MLVNTDTLEGKEGPWFWTHGTEFLGKRLPFGCKFIYKPSVTKMELGKFEEPSRVGVFAGYGMLSGYAWSKQYLVLDLEEFHEGDFSKHSTHLHQKVRNPHHSKQIYLYDNTLSFPLKAEYEKVISTFEGTKSAFARHTDQSDHPADPPPDFSPDGDGDDDGGQGGAGPGLPPSSSTLAGVGDPIAPEIIGVPPIIPNKVPLHDPNIFDEAKYPSYRLGKAADGVIYLDQN
jgi:hypothetical protein